MEETRGSFNIQILEACKTDVMDIGSKKRAAWLWKRGAPKGLWPLQPFLSDSRLAALSGLSSLNRALVQNHPAGILSITCQLLGILPRLGSSNTDLKVQRSAVLRGFCDFFDLTTAGASN
jgi:hypothetical protein